MLAARLALSALALHGAVSAQSFTVAGRDPAPNARAAATVAAVRVTFSSPVDPSSLDATTFAVAGRWSGPVPGRLSTSVDGRTVRFDPDRPCFPGEHVTVALSRGLRSAAGQPLPAGFAWRFTVGADAGGGVFRLAGTVAVRRPREPVVQLYGAFAGDLDRDGAPDLSMPCEAANDVRVLRNNGCGGFGGLTVHGQGGVTRPSTNEGADLDGDGWLDFAVGNIRDDSVSVLIGDAAGGYLPEVRYPVGASPRGLAVADFDGDGDVDIVTANRNSSDLSLLANRGDGTFDAARSFEGGGDGETAVAAVDADGDGRVDLFVGCYTSQSLVLLLGDGAGGFVPSASRALPGNPWKLDVGDVDGDGHVDVATCEVGSSTMTVIRGDGTGGLRAPASVPVGAFPTAVDLGDLDADGDVDAVVSCYAAATFELWRNDGAGTMTPWATLPAVHAGSCALLVDHDRDGDVDIVGIDEVADVVMLFEQQAPPVPAVQPASCAAALRVDNRGVGAGFGGRPARPVARGGVAFLGVSGPAGLPVALFAGAPLPVGPRMAFGYLNLQGPIVLHAAALLDPYGELLVPLTVPGALPAGVQVAWQSATLLGGDDPIVLGDPLVVEVR